MALYEALENRGVTVVNSSTGTALARDKLALARFFSGLGIAHPRTEGFAAPERGAIGSAPLPFPFVAKPRWGKMGRGVALIGDSDSWNAYMAGAPLEARGTRQAPEGSYIAQEYVASTHGRDLRFFFARWPGKRPWLCVERRGGGFLSNAHAGGHMEAFDPPPALARDAERAFAESGLVYGTVDFLFDDTQAGGFSACELNACPGFEELEKATGADAAGAVLKAALSGRIMT